MRLFWLFLVHFEINSLKIKEDKTRMEDLEVVGKFWKASYTYPQLSISEFDV